LNYLFSVLRFESRICKYLRMFRDDFKCFKYFDRHRWLVSTIWTFYWDNSSFGESACHGLSNKGIINMVICFDRTCSTLFNIFTIKGWLVGIWDDYYRWIGHLIDEIQFDICNIIINHFYSIISLHFYSLFKMSLSLLP
jgi:hypothetical protein